MMTQAFYSGISGLQTNSAGINVLSDNLANINTTGYRGYNIEFASLFEESINTNTNKSNQESTIGIGSRVQASTMLQTNGSLLLSDRSTDLAVDGNGWFGVRGEGNPLYTRDGSFTFDANADLVTTDGLHVLGTMGGNIGADDILTKVLDQVKLADVNNQEKLRFPKSLTYPLVPTANAKFFSNLGVDPELRTISASVIDSQGDKNQLKLEFTKDAIQNPPGSQWSVQATVTTLDGVTTYDTQQGSVIFDAQGALVSTTLSSIDNNGTPVKIDLGTGFEGVVSINSVVVSGSSLADGTIGGDLRGYAINQNAEVIATFTNGRQSSVGKIALYHFRNEQGLNRISGTRFEESSNSGNAIFFKDATGQNVIGASVVNFKLEGSNYDMTKGLTELIILQRAYDASSKSITTADQMMQKALNMDA
jgi:flagellar hook protein FlgE